MRIEKSGRATYLVFGNHVGRRRVASFNDQTKASMQLTFRGFYIDCASFNLRIFLLFKFANVNSYLVHNHDYHILRVMLRCAVWSIPYILGSNQEYL